MSFSITSLVTPVEQALLVPLETEQVSIRDTSMFENKFTLILRVDVIFYRYLFVKADRVEVFL